MTENFHSDEKQDLVNETLFDGGGRRGPGFIVLRMLVSARMVGVIIGQGGQRIKRICNETKARIIIVECPLRLRESAVIVSGKEEPNAPLPPAIVGLLRVLKLIVDGMANYSRVSIKLLVPNAQVESLMTATGEQFKSIKEESNCTVEVLKSELPVYAFRYDKILEVEGEPAGVQKGVELIASHLRKFLVDYSMIELIETLMKIPRSCIQNMPFSQPRISPHQSYLPHAPYGPGNEPNFHSMPPISVQPDLGTSTYRTSSQPAPSIIIQMSEVMLIHESNADAVIGAQGEIVRYTQEVTGARVTIRGGYPRETTVETKGTPIQVRAARQVIKSFLAQAAI